MRRRRRERAALVDGAAAARQGDDVHRSGRAEDAVALGGVRLEGDVDGCLRRNTAAHEHATRT